MSAERESPKSNVLSAIKDVYRLLLSDLTKQQRFIARGILEYAMSETLAIQEVKRARRQTSDAPGEVIQGMSSGDEDDQDDIS